MFVIAITGGIASGKSHVAQILLENGVPVLSADEIARTLTSAGGYAADGVIALFGTLDRAKIAEDIFSNPSLRTALNALVHPLVRREMDEQIAALPGSLCAVEVPLLFESGMEDMADEVWVAHVPREEQICRVMRRNGLSRDAALARIGCQMPTEEKLARACRAIDTSGAKEETRGAVEALLAAVRLRVETAP